MDNTIQLYIDKNQEIKGYPITSPDRVIDENGVNIKQQLDTMKNITYKEVTPEMFGAKGDGVTDDTQAIKNAITALNNNGNIHLKKKYRITSSLIVPHGVGVKGLNQGLFVDNSYILADITDNSPVITFTNKSTGVSVKDIKIKAYSEANKKKFIGIDVNKAEFIKIENITVEDCLYGYLLSGSLGSVYCCDFIDISAFRCDKGFYIKTSPNFINGNKIKIKEISDNVTGIHIEQGNLNTIIGESSEIGRNTSIGIRLDDGWTTIRGALWLEGSPIGIQVNGGKHFLQGEVYNICRTVVNDGELLQNGYSTNGNVHSSLSLNRNNEVCWYSFDDFNSKLRILNKTTGIYEDKYLANLTRVKDCLYGSGITTTNNFKLTKPNLSQDWTMLFNMKKLDSSLVYGDFLVFSDNDDTKPFTLSLMNESGGQFLLVNLRDTHTLFNFAIEERELNGQPWIILSYDSTTKTIASKTITGTVLNYYTMDLSNFSTPAKFSLRGGSGKLLYDEIIIYNRILKASEIFNLCTKQVASQQERKLTIVAASPSDYVNPIGGSIVINENPNKTKNIQQWIYSNELNSWLALGCGLGNTTQRENLRLTKNDSNYQFFDTTLNKIVIWNGTTWIGI